MKQTLLVATLVLLALAGNGQDNKPAKLKVFIDCTSTFCDMTFIRTEINVVDFLLDRVAADVHVLVTSLRNGSGGRQYQLIFYGQNSFKQTRDTLRLVTGPNATDFEIRDVMVGYIKMGLAPMVAKTVQAEKITIGMKVESTSDSARQLNQTKDNWNYWVIRIGANGNVNKDQVYTSSEIRGNVRLNRTTDQWKVSFGFFGGRETSSYNYDTDTGPLRVLVKNTNYSSEHMLVRTINSHWSYGYQINFLRNTFTNFKSSIYFLPQIEYSFFPYKDVNNRFLTIRYGVGPQRNDYYETTIYDKQQENLLGHNAELNLSLNQKWGTINTGLRYRNYFHDWKINNLGLAMQMEVRVTGGLFFYVYAFGSLVHDQIYLPGDGASEEEVLSRRRQLQSSYNFETFFGVNYRFGSKLNNFINPRFNSSLTLCEWKYNTTRHPMAGQFLCFAKHEPILL